MELMKTHTASDSSNGSQREPAPRAGKSALISEFFGRLTFSRKVMSERLSKSVYERLLNTIENNEPLDPEIANEVSQAPGVLDSRPRTG